MNEHIDETGGSDRPVRLSTVPQLSSVVWLFDNGKLAAAGCAMPSWEAALQEFLGS